MSRSQMTATSSWGRLWSILAASTALVNSAASSDRGTLLDTSLEVWDRHFNTNARGPFLMMQGVVRHLVETGKPGSIVNILSMAAYCGQSYLTAYSASKGGKMGADHIERLSRRIVGAEVALVVDADVSRAKKAVE